MAKKLLVHKRRQLRCQFPRESDADINISGSQADARRFYVDGAKKKVEGGRSFPKGPFATHSSPLVTSEGRGKFETASANVGLRSANHNF